MAFKAVSFNVGKAHLGTVIAGGAGRALTRGREFQLIAVRT